MTVTLAFHGAAGTVTGSCMLLTHPGGRVLIDCGMFQGSKTLKELNYRDFPFDPRSIDAVLLTHAHIDHSGLLPKLVKAGFTGRIHATGATRDLLTYMMPDAGYIQETEVDHLNRRRQQRGEAPVTPIYTKADGEALVSSVTPTDFDRWIDPGPGIRARFWNAGHILGAASIEVEVAGERRSPLRLLFSGDIGPGGKALEEPPQAPSGLDYVVVESTYGDRERKSFTPDERRAALVAEVTAAMAAGGNLLIPAFAVERTQELLFDLGTLFVSGSLPERPVFLDSPLAIRATEVFTRHAAALGEAAGANHPFDRRNFHFIDVVEHSKALNRIHSGAIIIAASGMCDAGRIRHHLKANLWRRDATVLLVGYQAPGTLGRLLEDGARAVRILGEEIDVAARIRRLDVYSAHADRRELLAWVAARQPVARAILLTHGEPQSLDGLARGIVEQTAPPVPVLTPGLDSRLQLDAAGPPVLETADARLPSDAVSSPDWHNRYAALVLELGAKLRGARTESDRQHLLDRLRKALED